MGKKANEEASKSKYPIMLLLPARTDTAYKTTASEYIAQQTFELKAIESATGKDMGAFLPPCEELVQVSTLAEKWTKEFSVKVTSAMLGKLANQNGLKTEDYGVLAMDKAQHQGNTLVPLQSPRRGSPQTYRHEALRDKIQALRLYRSVKYIGNKAENTLTKPH